MRRRLLIVVIGVGLAAAAWLVIAAVGAWQFRMETSEGHARVWPRDVSARPKRAWSGWPSVGPAEARSSTGSVLASEPPAIPMPPSRRGAVFPRPAPEARLAALARGRLALESGRYGLAETCLERAIRRGGRARRGGAAAAGTTSTG